MKRLFVITLSAALMSLAGLTPVWASTSGWTDPVLTPYVTPTGLDVTSQTYCNDPSTAFEYSTIRAITCADGSILDWSRYVPDPFVKMTFGSVRTNGLIKLGTLRTPQQLRLPDGYRLYPIEDTAGTLLVDDGVVSNGVADAAYYPDLEAKINWTDFSIESPVAADKFVDSELYLGLYPYGLSTSNNRQWAVAYSTTYGYVRLNLATRHYEAFGESYTLDYGRRRVAVVATSAITDDGQTAALADNMVDAPGGLRLYSFDTNRSPCRLVASRYLTDCPVRSLTSMAVKRIDSLKGFRSVRFADNKALDTEVAVGIGSSNRFDHYRISLDAPPASNDRYIALGDSIASGEGAHYYRAGTDVSGGNKCHTSFASYPYLLRAEAESVACSGAKIADINGMAWGQRTGRAQSSYSQAEIEQLLIQFMPGNLNQLAFIKKYQPSAVTLSVGGNDLGFATLLAGCIDPRRAFTGNGCFPTYEDRLEILQTIQDQYEPLAGLYRTLRQTSPTSRFYVVGYPQLVSDGGRCGLNVQLGQDERQAINIMTTAFNTVIKQAAQNNGFLYVDVADAFAGHKLCESGKPAVNGITAGDDSMYVAGRPVLGQEGFHPTAYGHTLLAKAIKDQTANLTLTLPSIRPQPPAMVPEVDQWRDQADHTGRPIGERQIVDVTLEATGSNYTLKYIDNAKVLTGDQTITITVNNVSGVASYKEGSWQTVFNGSLPDSLLPVEIRGQDRFGRPLTLMSVIESKPVVNTVRINTDNFRAQRGP